MIESAKLLAKSQFTQGEEASPGSYWGNDERIDTKYQLTTYIQLGYTLAIPLPPAGHKQSKDSRC